MRRRNRRRGRIGIRMEEGINFERGERKNQRGDGTKKEIERKEWRRRSEIPVLERQTER